MFGLGQMAYPDEAEAGAAGVGGPKNWLKFAGDIIGCVGNVICGPYRDAW